MNIKQTAFLKKFLTLSGTIVLLASVAVGVNQVQKQQATKTQAQVSCTHYVSTSGSDSNSGTSTSNAWRTIQKGVNGVSAGKVLCVRGGTYHEKVTISKSGTSSNPITIRAYPGEQPVIDGEAGVDCLNCGLPSGSLAKTDPKSGKGHNWEGLVYITGSHIVFDGFESKRSMGRGILMANSSSSVRNVTLKNCRVQYARSAGINIQYANGVLVEGCRVWRNADFATYSRGNELNWPIIVSALWSENVTFRNNEIFNNWGEGIVAGRGSTNVLIEGNVVYDNYAAQAYSNRCQYCTFRNNLMYFSDDPEFYRGGHPSGCIILNNENASTNQTKYHDAKNVTIVNNLLMGCQHNIGMWAQGAAGTKAGTPNVLIAHNTLINAHETAIYMTRADSPPYTNVRIKNNIIIEQSGTVATIASGQDVTFSNNLWWPNRPPSSAVGSGDVYSDPKLSRSGSTSAGSLSPTYFTIASANSPAIGKAKVDSDSISKDYFGSGRDSQPDIGAHEYGGSTPLPTTYPSPNPTTAYPTSIPTFAPTQVPTAGPTVTSVPPGPSGNVLTNPSFEDGTNSWYMHNVGGDVAYSVVSPGSHGSNSTRLTINNPGTQLQFYQSGITLEPNTEYSLSFVAYSNTGHDLSVYVHEHDDDYTNYGLAGHVANLSTNWNTYQTTFTTNNFTQTVEDARLRFWFGPFDEVGDEYFIDNVILTKTEETSSIQGDANGDGVVDGIDYVIWFTNFGKTTQNGSSDGDFNTDNKVDGIDYVIWFNNFGVVIPTATNSPTPILPTTAPTSTRTPTNVPTPTTSPPCTGDECNKIKFEYDFEDIADNTLFSGTSGFGRTTEKARRGQHSMSVYLHRDMGERSEVRIKDPNNPSAGSGWEVKLGTEHWIGLSYYFPSPFPPDDGGGYGDMVFQFKGIPDASEGEEWNLNPVVSLNLMGSQWQIRNRWDSNRITVKPNYEDWVYRDLGAYETDKWIDIIWQYKPSYGSDGILKLWMNGVLVFERYGPNTFNDARGPATDMGIYKWHWYSFNSGGNSKIQERYFYIDEIRIAVGANGYDLVNPAQY